jgi:hypothetical protein
MAKIKFLFLASLYKIRTNCLVWQRIKKIFLEICKTVPSPSLNFILTINEQLKRMVGISGRSENRPFLGRFVENLYSVAKVDSFFLEILQTGLAVGRFWKTPKIFFLFLARLDDLF